MGREKRRNIFLNLAIVLVLADWWELFSWMNQAPRRFGCKPVWGLCEICNVNKCVKCGPLRPSQGAWKLSMLPVCFFKIMMSRGFMFDASIDSGCFVDVFSWMKPLRLKYFLLFGAAKLQIWTKSPQSSVFFSSARISELGHKFRLNWVRLKFQAEDFVGMEVS